MAELSEGFDLSNIDATREVQGITSAGFEGLCTAREAVAGLPGDWA